MLYGLGPAYSYGSPDAELLSGGDEGTATAEGDLEEVNKQQCCVYVTAHVCAALGLTDPN